MKQFFGWLKAQLGLGRTDAEMESAAHDEGVAVGERLTTAFLTGMQQGCHSVASKQAQAVWGLSAPDEVEDAEYEVKEDLTELSRAELMARLKENGGSPTRDDTKETLIEKIESL